jgi:ribonuclease P protein component
VKPWQPLSSRKAFLRTLKEGRRAEGPFFFLRRIPEGPGRRVGFSAQSGFRSAVSRNRAKRWMREALRKNLALLPGEIKLVLVAKTRIQSAGFAAVVAEMERLLSEGA